MLVFKANGLIQVSLGEAPGTGHCVDLSAEGATQSPRDLSLNRAYSAEVRSESSPGASPQANLTQAVGLKSLSDKQVS